MNIFSFRKHPAENLRRAGAIGYRLWLGMSAKPTLVVQIRRTDEADGDGNFDAGASRLRRECAASAREGSCGAACKSACGLSGAGSRATGAGVQDAKRENQLRDRHGNG